MLADLRFTFRSFAKSPGFIAAVTDLPAAICLLSCRHRDRRATNVDPMIALRVE